MTEWYASHHEATHFRPHPAMPVNPTYLPMTHDWDDVKQVITLNSSVAVDAILLGVPTVCEDEGAMAWPGFKNGEDRLPWLHWLAHTQHHHEEIQDGSALRQMFCHN